MADPARTIAIATYNRQAELSDCLACLKSARGLANWQVVIRDDASTDYDIADIAGKLAFPCTTTRNPENTGVDANNVALLRACLESGANRILLLDNDMIVSTDALEFIDKVFERTDGILSLFNSVLHEEGPVIDDDLVSKDTIGGAATVWDAGVLRTILDRVVEGPVTWDWQVCAITKELGIRFAVARRSRAQHIGIYGVNSQYFGDLEFGRDFIVETVDQARALAATHTALMQAQKGFRKPRRHQRWWRTIAPLPRPTSRE